MASRGPRALAWAEAGRDFWANGGQTVSDFHCLGGRPSDPLLYPNTLNAHYLKPYALNPKLPNPDPKNPLDPKPYKP